MSCYLVSRNWYCNYGANTCIPIY